MKRTSSLVGLLAATGLLTACTSGTGPGRPVEEEFALTSVGEGVVPYRFFNETWIADTIRFHEGGREWSRVSVLTLHGEGTEPDPLRRTSEGYVTYQGSRIVLDFDCNDVVLRSCVAPDTVRLTGSGLSRLPNRYGINDLAYPLFNYDLVP